MTAVAGIDIGTSQCKTAIVDPSGKPSIVINTRGEQRTPSALFVPENGPPLVGNDAIEQGYLCPERFATDFKLDLASKDNLLRNGTVLTAVDATTLLIAHQKEIAEKTMGAALQECVATCPANYRDDHKQALLECYARNNIDVLKLVSEPCAAAMAHAAHGPRDRRTIAVYDMGGGTFDVSVVSTDGSEITVRSTEGVARLGGNDLSRNVKQFVLEQLKTKQGHVPSKGDEPLFHYDLDQRIERAKVSLCTQASVPVVLVHSGKQTVIEISQSDFHRAIDPLVSRSLEAFDRAIAAAAMTIDQIDHLIMVGGPSRIPYIQHAVANHTGLVPKTDIDPEKAIAYGAALASVAELARQGRTATVRGQVIPAPDMFVRDVTAHAVGCCVVDTSTSDRRLRNSVLIPKNTPIPFRKTDRFFLERDDQRRAQIEILQGDPDAVRDDCLLIGELVLDDLPEETKATDRVQVEYVVDGNGMVTATATDLVSGKQQTVSVDYKKGIKPRDKPAAA